MLRRGGRARRGDSGLPNSLFLLALKYHFLPPPNCPTQEANHNYCFAQGSEQWQLPNRRHRLPVLHVLGTHPQSLWAVNTKPQHLGQGRAGAASAFKCPSVCFFCSIDWKDYDDREPRHKGQSEVLESLLQQVRALHQHYSCRGKDKICAGPSAEVSVAPVILAVS